MQGIFLLKWINFNDCRDWKKCEKVRKNAKILEKMRKMCAKLREIVSFW